MRVVGLGAFCELDPRSEATDDDGQYSFRVSEFAVLDTGERVTLHAERGFSGWANRGSIWAHESVESITRNVLTTVLPDDDEPVDEHPWEWLAGLARAQGIDVTADDLRPLPYEVVLGERVLRRLSTGA